MSYNFLAFLNRMKYIDRWSLMRNTMRESVAEHSHIVAMLSYSLAVIANKKFGKNIDANLVGMLAVFHESSEVITGDLPTPIKYNNDKLRSNFKELEKDAEDKLLKMLPSDLFGDFAPLVQPDTSTYEYRIMKVADKLSAYIKCVEEEKCGNNEFLKAKATIMNDIISYNLDEAQYFIDNFLPSYQLNLDELTE